MEGGVHYLLCLCLGKCEGGNRCVPCRHIQQENCSLHQQLLYRVCKFCDRQFSRSHSGEGRGDSSRRSGLCGHLGERLEHSSWNDLNHVCAQHRNWQETMGEVIGSALSVYMKNYYGLTCYGSIVSMAVRSLSVCPFRYFSLLLKAVLTTEWHFSPLIICFHLLVGRCSKLGVSFPFCCS